MKETIIRWGLCVVGGVLIGTVITIFTGNSDLGLAVTALSTLILTTNLGSS